MSASVGSIDPEDLLEYFAHGCQRVELARLHLGQEPPQLGIAGDGLLEMAPGAARGDGEHLPREIRPPPLLSSPLCSRNARCSSIFSQSSGTCSPRTASVRTIGGFQSRLRSSPRIERTSLSIVFAAA